jgi:dTDP-glucose pyrophosphorylase
MNNEANIILCGGPLNRSNLPIGSPQSNAMVAVNGKPVIGWILDDFLVKGIHRVTVVLREEDQRLKDFLHWAYAERMELILAPLYESGTILQSLQTGLRRFGPVGMVRIVLGDTLIKDSYLGEEDFVYVGSVEDSQRWCLAVTGPDGYIKDYIDKRDDGTNSKLALAGYYHLLRGDHLLACVDEAVANEERELSAVLRRYGVNHPIKAVLAKEWFDFGHIDNLVAARRSLLQPRSFNSLTIDPVLNTITKVSLYDDKLRDELDWYLNIPDELKVLTPRILSHRTTNGRLTVVEEYYGYPTLSELYVYGDLGRDAWMSILRHILRIHQAFMRYEGKIPPNAVRRMYLDKTYQRLQRLIEQDPEWRDWLDCETVTFNGRTLLNLRELDKPLRHRIEALITSAPIRAIHGDFCFSNILFDVNNKIVRLIDPRGSFGCKGIYGDVRYDIAKLRHSVCSLYDYIIADMFRLEQSDRTFTGHIYANGTPKLIGPLFDRLVEDMGYKLDDIRLIEGLLFISMLPLHHGHSQRQRLMFLTGLTLLNEVL